MLRGVKWPAGGVRLAMLALAASLTVASSVSAETLTYATDMVPKDPIYDLALKPLFEETKADPELDIGWRLIPGGQLLGARETLTGVKAKLADATIVVPSFFRTDLPNINVLFQFISYGDNIVAGTGAALEALYLNCPECIADYTANNTVPLASSSGGQYHLYCSKPVNSVADLKGRKIRGVGALARFIDMMGATPLNLPPNEGVTAIQRGTMDCVIGPLAWLIPFGYVEAAPNVVRFPMGYVKGLGLIVMNQDTWSSLDVSKRKALLDRMGMATARMVIDSNYNVDKELLDKGEALGLKVTDGDGSFEEVFKRFNEAEIEATIAAGEQSGALNARRLVETMISLYPKWEKIAETTGFDVDAVAEAYQREVYGKLDAASFGVK